MKEILIDPRIFVELNLVREYRWTRKHLTRQQKYIASILSVATSGSRVMIGLLTCLTITLVRKLQRSVHTDGK